MNKTKKLEAYEMDKEMNMENMGKEQNKEDSFRQNASFAEKNLLNERIFHEFSDDHDIRQIDRKKVESLLQTANIRQSEPAPEFVHLGRKGINRWIWEHKVSNTISPPLLGFLATKLKNDASRFYQYYKRVSELMQKVATFQHISTEELNTIHFFDPVCMEHLKNAYKTRKEQNFLCEITGYLNKEAPQLISVANTLVETPIKKSLHPKILDYLQSLTKKGISINTQKLRIGYLNMLLPWLCKQMADFQDFTPGNISFLKIKEMHLIEFRSHLLKQLQHGQYSQITISECIYGIKDFFQFLKETFGFPNPAVRLKSIKAPRYKERRIPSDLLLHRFFQVIEMYSDSPLLESIAFRLMLGLGLRSDEVGKVAWKDINLGCRTICIHSKGGREHVLPLVGELYQLLITLRQEQTNDGFLFGDKTKSFYSRLLSNFHLYALIAGWDFPGGLHLFRHIFVTRLAETNPLPQLLKELTRVERMDTVSLYLHLAQYKRHLSREVNKLTYGINGRDEYAPI